MIIVPRIVYLAKTQGIEKQENNFYGNNYGLGFVILYKLNDQTRPFISTYIPIAGGKNSIDKVLEYNKSIIYTLGLNYRIDKNQH